MLRYFITALLAGLIFSSPSHAVKLSGETEYTYRHSSPGSWIWTTSFQDASWDHTDRPKRAGYAEIKVKFIWKAYSLYGEPVFLTKAKWTFLEGGSIYLAEEDKSFLISEIPPNVLNKIKIVRMIPTFSLCKQTGNCAPNNTGPFVRRDVGSLDVAGGDWSFNTPGSPKWDMTFLSRPNGGYLKPDKAKERFKSGFSLACYSLHDIWFDLNAVREWYRDSLKRKEKKRKLEAALESDNFFDDEDAPPQASAADFFDNESDLETEADYSLRKQQEDAERKYRELVGKAEKDFKAEKERFQEANCGIEVSEEGKTWHCDEPFATIRGNINPEALKKGASFSLNGHALNISENGTFEMNLELESGENRFTIKKDERGVKSFIVRYTEFHPRYTKKEIDYSHLTGIILGPRYDYICNHCGRGSTLPASERHTNSCPYRCRFE